jgi:hypothetical protein
MSPDLRYLQKELLVFFRKRVEKPVTAVGLPKMCTIDIVVQACRILLSMMGTHSVKTHGHLYLHLPRQITGVMNSKWNPPY